MKTEPSPKSRQDIIDTTLRQQAEVKILKYLLLLLIMTVLYEMGLPAISLWGLPPEPEETVSSAQRIMIPLKRLDRLEHSLTELANDLPMTRDVILLRISELKTHLQLLSDPKARPIVQKNLIATLESLWNYFHSPIWTEPIKFSAINQDLFSLLNMMGKKPSDEVHLPDLPFGPKQLTTISIPKRDLFRFTE